MIVAAAGVEQEIQTPQLQSQKPLQKETERGEGRGSTRLWEREEVKLETCISGRRMHTDGEGEQSPVHHGKSRSSRDVEDATCTLFIHTLMQLVLIDFSSAFNCIQP